MRGRVTNSLRLGLHQGQKMHLILGRSYSTFLMPKIVREQWRVSKFICFDYGCTLYKKSICTVTDSFSYVYDEAKFQTLKNHCNTSKNYELHFLIASHTYRERRSFWMKKKIRWWPCILAIKTFLASRALQGRRILREELDLWNELIFAEFMNSGSLTTNLIYPNWIKS